ncbi:hypothetical protein H0H92_009159 [Tricholoma furcatifolium]|nr:hypothetical protein H0H92_009159 [Tricholoma furcatifolium]
MEPYAQFLTAAFSPVARALRGLPANGGIPLGDEQAEGSVDASTVLAGPTNASSTPATPVEGTPSSPAIASSSATAEPQSMPGAFVVSPSPPASEALLSPAAATPSFTPSAANDLFFPPLPKPHGDANIPLDTVLDNFMAGFSDPSVTHGPDNFQMPAQPLDDYSWMNDEFFSTYNNTLGSSFPVPPASTSQIVSDNLPALPPSLPAFSGLSSPLNISLTPQLMPDSATPQLVPDNATPTPQPVPDNATPTPQLVPDNATPLHVFSDLSPLTSLPSTPVPDPVPTVLEPTSAPAGPASAPAGPASMPALGDKTLLHASAQNVARSRSGRQLIDNASKRAEELNKIGTNKCINPDPSVNKENIPPSHALSPTSTWAASAKGHLLSADLGAHWTECVSLWATFEASFDAPSKVGLAAKLRPEEWQKWTTKGNRAYDATPVISDPLEFGYAVMAWWKHLQPEFRAPVMSSSPSVLPPPVYAPTSPGAKDPWAPLRKPGPNGFVALMLLLVWWGQALTRRTPFQEDSRPFWDQMVNDVARCLQQMIASPPVKRKRVAGADKENSQKRARKA